MSDSVSEREHPIKSACEAQDLASAATQALTAYGEEVLGFLRARLGNASDAHEVFSMFAEDLWVGLPAFAWRCSMRTWLYTLARNASTRYVLEPHRHARRNVSLSAPAELTQLVERVRTSTQVFAQTAVKDRVRALREQLDVEDQLLLVLRVDRQMAWRDIAMTLAGDCDLEAVALDRRAAQLRKSFERVKSEVKRLAKQSGLLQQRE